METIATLDRVREAKRQLLEARQRPSADRIIKVLQGGSKTTVLAHLQSLADEEARRSGVGDIPIEILTSSAAAFSRKLWDEATRMASAAFENRILGLLETQNALFEDLHTAAAAEETLTAALNGANERIAALETELEGRARAEQHLAKISEMLRSKESPQYKPIIQLLRLIENGEPRPVEEVLNRMVELGHLRKQAQTARSHAIAYGYATEHDDGAVPTLTICEKGRTKLSPRRAV